LGKAEAEARRMKTRRVGSAARNMHVKLRPGGTDSYPLWGLHNLDRRNYPAATVIFFVLNAEGTNVSYAA
jgi:hypothetical protein